MIYQELINNICSRINFHTAEFSKKYNVGDNFLLLDNNNIAISIFENLLQGDNYLSIVFKYNLDFNINGLVININEDIDLNNRILLIRLNSGEEKEIRNFTYENGRLFLEDFISSYADIDNIYYIDKSLYTNNFEVKSNIGNELTCYSSQSLSGLNPLKYSIYQVFGVANCFFIEDENKIDSFKDLIGQNNSLYIIPNNNVGSKSNNTQSVAVSENNKGNELNLTRVHNFYLLVKIIKMNYNVINNRISNKELLRTLDITIPAIIKAVGGFIPQNVDSCVSYKGDFLYESNDSCLLYRIDFEFISTLSNSDYMEDLEFIINNIKIQQGVNI